MMLGCKGRSFSELIFRFFQYSWNVGDHLRMICGQSNHARQSIESLSPGRFFIDYSMYSAIRDVYAQNPAVCQRLLERADAVCGRRFDLLGYSALCFGDGGLINWLYDPVNKVEPALVWWQKLLKPGSFMGADPKVIWELNRHQHMVTLAQAYVVSCDERYRTEIINQLRDWMDANPPKYGINWSSSLELAYRSIAWLWAWVLCGGGHAFGPLTERFIECLVLQATHIEHNLSIYYSPNTHLTGEALGLYYIGTLLPWLKGARRWREAGKTILLDCLDKQVLADGGYMERTLWYHRYTTDIYLHFYLLGLINNDDLPEYLPERILSLARFMSAALRPDRTLPHLGDDDGGRLLALDGLAGDDPRGLLYLVSVMFKCDECAFLSEGVFSEALWLLGPESIDSFAQLDKREPLELSIVRSATGYAFLRSGWSGNDLYLSFDFGPHGWLNGGHAHADMLSVLVCSGSHTLVADPGTYSYQEPLRDWFRGAEGHAVVMIDGEYPAVPADLFHWQRVPELRSYHHQSNDRIEYVTAVMDAGTWQHRREIFFLTPQMIVLLDTIISNGVHDTEVRFPLADRAWRLSGGGCVSTLSGRIATIRQAGSACRVELLDGWNSNCYGHSNEAFILRFSLTTGTPVIFATLIDVSGEDHLITRRHHGHEELFLIQSAKDGRTIASVQSSGEGEPVCAAFAV